MFFLIAFLSLVKAQAFSLGLEQTFGTDGYSGSRAPVLIVKTLLNEKENRYLSGEVEIGSYWDNLVNARYLSIEPKIRVFAESEASVQASFRGVLPTDNFSSQDFGIEIRYTLLQPPNDTEPKRFVEELELLAEIRRRSYSDGLFASRLARPSPLTLNEVYVVLGARLLHNQWGTFKPNFEAYLTKSFYSDAIGANDRANPMGNLKGVTPFISMYQDLLLNLYASWRLGRPGGFVLKPQLKFSVFSSAGTTSGGASFGPSLDASTEGFGVTTGVDFLYQGSTFRNFLTLGFYVTL